MKLDQRPIPEAALTDKDSIEMARIWIAQQGLHCSIKVGVFSGTQTSESRAWGIVLADIARHVSNAMSDDAGIDPSTTVSEIVNSFNSEINKPSSITTGQFSRKH